MISGFHKLTKDQRIELLINHTGIDDSDRDILEKFLMSDQQLQTTIEKVSENVIGNFVLPYALIPNMLINGKTYFVPAVTEESSVVAAAASAAKFWYSKGGFQCNVSATKKVGNVYFNWQGSLSNLKDVWGQTEPLLMASTDAITTNMRKRGGGIVSILPEQLNGVENEFKLTVLFDTQNAMGANFINACLEQLALTFKELIGSQFSHIAAPEVTMAILSNHTPECIVSCKVHCDVHELTDAAKGVKGYEFAKKFKRAVDIANVDAYRAVTHNKGIMNGVAAAVVATANDFRAVEAASHAYAVKDGSYRSLSKVTIENDVFTFTVELPLALGTVGGLTSLHPMAALSLKILDHPSAKQLMQIVAACGLASNFSAIKSLISEGISKGHMRMHLGNLLMALNATEQEQALVNKFFEDKVVTMAAVRAYLETLRT